MIKFFITVCILIFSVSSYGEGISQLIQGFGIMKSALDTEAKNAEQQAKQAAEKADQNPQDAVLKDEAEQAKQKAQLLGKVNDFINKNTVPSAEALNRGMGTYAPGGESPSSGPPAPVPSAEAGAPPSGDAPAPSMVNNQEVVTPEQMAQATQEGPLAPTPGKSSDPSGGTSEVQLPDGTKVQVAKNPDLPVNGDLARGTYEQNGETRSVVVSNKNPDLLLMGKPNPETGLTDVTSVYNRKTNETFNLEGYSHDMADSAMASYKSDSGKSLSLGGVKQSDGSVLLEQKDFANTSLGQASNYTASKLRQLPGVTASALKSLSQGYSKLGTQIASRIAPPVQAAPAKTSYNSPPNFNNLTRTKDGLLLLPPPPEAPPASAEPILQTQQFHPTSILDFPSR